MKSSALLHQCPNVFCPGGRRQGWTVPEGSWIDIPNLSTLQNERNNKLKTKFKELIPLHHTAPCNLINPDARLQFLHNRCR
jgi:hypothetical protein